MRTFCYGYTTEDILRRCERCEQMNLLVVVIKGVSSQANTVYTHLRYISNIHIIVLDILAGNEHLKNILSSDYLAGF